MEPRAGLMAPPRETPVACIVIGMAGSGKTTLMQRVNAHLHTCGCPAYLLNLDPAVTQVPFGCHIDIRDTVNYKQVMSQFDLGPNGGILTALNLFTTRFHQVADLIEKRIVKDRTKVEDSDNGSKTIEKEEGQGKGKEKKNEGNDGNDGGDGNGKEKKTGGNSVANRLQYILADTPGQIEIFTWSASGAIISETFASLAPTVVLYVVDAARCAESPVSFMSNMLHCCSVMYKTRLPMIVVFNKADIPFEDERTSVNDSDEAGDEGQDPAMRSAADVCLDWMEDLDTFQSALDSTSSYMATLSRSMALVLGEFYAGVRAVSLSAVSGEGTHALFDAISEAADEFDKEYAPLIERRRKEKEAMDAEEKEGHMESLRRDMEKAKVAEDRAASRPEVTSSIPVDDQELSDTDVPDAPFE